MKKLLLVCLLVLSGLANAKTTEEFKLPDVLPSFQGHCTDGYKLNVTVLNYGTNNGTEFRCWKEKAKNGVGCENTPMPDGTVYYSYEDILGKTNGYWKVPIKKEFCVKDGKK